MGGGELTNSPPTRKEHPKGTSDLDPQSPRSTAPLLITKKPQRPQGTEEKKQREKKTNPPLLVVPPNSPVGVLALQLVGCRHSGVGHANVQSIENMLRSFFKYLLFDCWSSCWSERYHWLRFLNYHHSAAHSVSSDNDKSVAFIKNLFELMIKSNCRSHHDFTSWFE